MQIDRSNGYEAIAHTFAEARSNSIGATKVREWARNLAPGAIILDIGCGGGVPISQVLIEDGFNVFGVDASETLVQEFRQRFPSQMVECSTVEDSSFFDRKFDAVVSWGLMFLLPADAQRELIGKVARALNPGGRFLFTSPRDLCTWLDGMTGLESRSLGQKAYEACFQENGLELVGNAVDEGENYYYFACMT
ncbi:MAG: class I SAM-dependent methyltransferase [Armatimonadetes bacterium]|nr:class I SAM-dependent methyltransferase [Armatimonadota bacterium]